jgi:hypothetical protein
MDIKIILTIKDQKIELTSEELKELRKIIDDIIPVETLSPIETEKEYVPYYPWYPSYPEPWWVEPNITWKLIYTY